MHQGTFSRCVYLYQKLAPEIEWWNLQTGAMVVLYSTVRAWSIILWFRNIPMFFPAKMAITMHSNLGE